MKAELIDSMGTDLTVVNSARVSFAKESDWIYREEVEVDLESRCYYEYKVKDRLQEKDARLIKYLARHEHTSPFRHCFATFRVKAPIFVARQLVKHQVGMSWNEVSRRYVDDEPEFYWPDKWRKRSEDKKQGSGEEIGFELRRHVDTQMYKMETALKKAYNYAITSGIAPEQARMILPQNTYTEWYWSGSLQAWAHMCNLRCKPDTQQETRIIADMIDAECAKLWPVSWEALRHG